MPGLFPVIGDTEEEAQANYEELQDLILPEEGLKLLSPYVGDVDLSKYDLKSHLSKWSLPMVTVLKVDTN